MAHAASAPRPPLDRVERRLLDEFQRDLPLEPRPFARMAEQLGLEEGEVIERLQALRDRRCISRVGAVLPPNRVGASTLAALAVPQDRIEDTAALVNGYPEVNHNYEREHRFNLWFVVTAETPAHVAAVLDEIAARTGLPLLDLPLVEPFHIDLGFPLQWA